MANNVVANPGAGGATFATDEIPVTLEHYQYVKLADGTADSTAKIPGDAANGLDVDVTRLPALVAGTANIGDVDVLTLPNVTIGAELPAGVQNIGDVDVATLPATVHSADFDTGAGTDTTLAFGIAVPASGGAAVVPGDATAGLKVDLGADNDVTVTGTVTANLAAGTNNIGDVDVLSLPAIPAGTNNIGDVDVLTLPNVTLAAGTNTNEVVGDVAQDAGIAGNPVGVGGVSIDMDDTAPPNRVNAEADAVRVGMDRDGSVFTHPHGPQVWSYHENSSSALTDATVHAAPGAGLSLYVTDIVCSTGAATALNIFFEEGAATVLGPWYLEAVAGRGVSLHFQTPKKITANTALTVTTSAAIAHSIDVTGFTAQG